jgi:hypothetical protein
MSDLADLERAEEWGELGWRKVRDLESQLAAKDRLLEECAAALWVCSDTGEGADGNTRKLLAKLEAAGITK